MDDNFVKILYFAILKKVLITFIITKENAKIVKIKEFQLIFY